MTPNNSKPTNCPKCSSDNLQENKPYGYWECLDCGQYWALDADDPDYEEMLSNEEVQARLFERFVERDRATQCANCDGGGLIVFYGETRSCPKCNGTGSI
ncbi:hypothetical protein Cal7507_1151 [Calothrix sp. PCC 7507]|nr:hypothetical protein Cal7507_1151 [Calothrix sp. PCC 7507]